MVCRHLAKFLGHRYCGDRDKLFSVCDVIKELSDYFDRIPSR